jgi:hypothetical protein
MGLSVSKLSVTPHYLGPEAIMLHTMTKAGREVG